MRRIIFIAIFVSTLLFLTGCGEKPENTVSAFLDASKTFNLEKMKEYVDPDNTEISTEISDVLNYENEELSKYFIDYLTQNASKLEYKIIDSKVNNNNSIVTVEIKFIDAAPVLKATIAEIFPKILAQAFSGIEMTDAQMNELVSTTMEAQIKLIDGTYITKTIDIELIKISDKWYLSKVNDELSNAILSNFITAAKELADSFNASGVDLDN